MKSILLVLFFVSSFSQAAEFEGVFKVKHQSCTYNHYSPLQNKCLTERKKVEFKLVGKILVIKSYNSKGDVSEIVELSTINSYHHDPESNASLTTSYAPETSEAVFVAKEIANNANNIKSDEYTLIDKGSYYYLRMDHRFQFTNNPNRVDFFIESLDLVK